MSDPRTFTAHFGDQVYPGQIAALEGNRGEMRVQLEGQGQSGWPTASDEGELEMQDGARFRVGVLESLSSAEGVCEYRLKLLGQV
ncbi:hypothetical protein DESA109040_12435 [Deinococcus saxicola]|uniref:hypothetical protein n=1 Tax=Deinococcus saxicola TaxID=249406 RepID=UPI0039EDF140